MSLQNVYGYNRNTPSGTQYASFSGGSNLFAAENAVRAPWRGTGVFRNFVVLLRQAPGVGTSRTFTVRINGSSSALTVTISGTNTTGTYTATDVSVTDMDLVALQASETGSPAGTLGFSWVVEFDGVTSGESAHAWYVGTANTSPTNLWSGVFNSTGSFLESSPTVGRQVISAPGSLTGSAICVDSAPGLGNGLTHWVNLNGVRQDGTGGTVDTSCALVGAGTTAFADYTLPVVGGDIVYMEWDVSGAFTTRNWGIGIRFLATTPGESQVCGLTTTQSNSATEYHPIASASSVLFDADEADALNIAGLSDSRLSRLYLLRSAAPGSGNTYTNTLRLNAGSTALTATMADAAQTASDLIHSVNLVASDVLSMQTVPASSPTVSVVSWTMTQTLLTPIMVVTQHVVEVICDEDIDDDPPDPVGDCTGGGTVATGTNPGAEVSLDTATAPLMWMELTVPGSPVTVYRWAKDWIPHGALPAEKRVLSFGVRTLALTDLDGGPETSTVTTRLADVDGVIRALWLADALKGAMVEYYCADLATIKADLVPSRRFRGYVSLCEPAGDRLFDLTSEDALSARLNSRDGQDLEVPRQIIEDTIATLAADEEMFDKPAPDIFGSISSDTGAWAARYVGKAVAPGFESLGQLAWFLVGLGVCKVKEAFVGGLGATPTSYIQVQESAFNSYLFVPGKTANGGWIEANAWSERGDRRWTLIAGKPNSTPIKLAIDGTIPIRLNVCGLQDDQSLGSPHATVDSPAYSLQLFLVNRLLQDATDDWLPVPIDDGVTLIDTDTFEAVHDVLESMTGTGSVSAIAGVIGAEFEQRSWRDRVAEWCRSFGIDFGTNRHGQGVLTVLDLTDDAESARAFTERQILAGSVQFPSRLPVENEIRFVHTQRYVPPLQALAPPTATRLPPDAYAARWESGLQTLRDETSITALGGGTTGLRRSAVQEYTLSRDSGQSSDVAQRRLDLLSPPNGRIEVRLGLSLRVGHDVTLGEIVTAEHRDLPWTGSRRCQVRRLEEDFDALTISALVRDVDDLLP